MAARRTALVAAAVPVGVLLSGMMVWQASYAAFTDTTDNAGNQWTAGTVTLTDNDSGAALFAVSGLTPGTTTQECIEVSYGGTVAADVRVYGAYTGGTLATNPLAEWLTLTVERQSGAVGCGTASGWTTVETGGTLADFVSTRTSFATAAAGWAPAAQTPPATVVETYRFTTVVQDTDAAQGDTAGVTLTWEAQNS